MPPANPQWLIAKPLLEQDYRDGKATDDMTPDQVIELRPGVYGKVPRKNFLANWRAMKNRGTQSPPAQTNNLAWKIAKPLLEKDFRERKATDTMLPHEVIALRPGIYNKVPQEHFVTNWKSLLDQIKNDGKKAKKGITFSAWEIAKPLLEEDFIAGKATENMTPDEVIALRPRIYGRVPRSNFLTNWRSLKLRITGDMDRAKADKERYDHDMEFYVLAKDLPWEWHGSEAERLLKEDVAMGRDLRYPPWLLYLKHKEYQEFDYNVFRKHIYQEARSELETPYWMVHKEKKAAKKKALEEAVDKALERAKLDDLDAAFSQLKIN